jgi:hypothetical protein
MESGGHNTRLGGSSCHSPATAAALAALAAGATTPGRWSRLDHGDGSQRLRRRGIRIH